MLVPLYNYSYVTGIRDCESARPEHYWRDVLWIAWGLAKPPKSYRYEEETAVNPDTSDWKM
jgi:hypothetical protein